MRHGHLIASGLLAGYLLVGDDRRVTHAGSTSTNVTVGVVIGSPRQPASRAGRKSTYTWGAAEITLKLQQMKSIRRVRVVDDLYHFEATRGDSRVAVVVSRFTGRIIHVSETRGY